MEETCPEPANLAVPDPRVLIEKAWEIDRRATAGPWLDKPTPRDPDGWPTCVIVASTAPGTGNGIYAQPPGGSHPGADKDFVIAARILIPDMAAALSTAPDELANLELACEGRDQELAELKGRVAFLKAENDRLYEGWPESDDRVSRVVYHSKILQKGWVYWRGHERVGPFGAKRDAVQARLGLAAPAGGGE